MINWILEKFELVRVDNIKELKEKLALLESKDHLVVDEIKQQVLGANYNRYVLLDNKYSSLYESSEENKKLLSKAYDDIHFLEMKILDLQKRLRRKKR